MSRSVVDIPTTLTLEQVNAIFYSFAQIEHFELVSYQGQNVFKKGMGILTGPQYVSFSHFGNRLRIEAWLKFALLPGLYLGEMGLDGFVGIVPKTQLKERVNRLLFSLQQAEQNTAAATAVAPAT